MNKKNLSVVMAGAILATSVAPVLAEATTSEMSANDLGLLIEKVRTKLNEKTFSNETSQDKIRNGKYAGKSVYFITVNGKNTGLDNESSQSEFQAEFKDLKAGDVVEIWQYGYTEETVGETTKVYRTKEVKETFKSTDEIKAFAETLGYGPTTDSDGNINYNIGVYSNVIEKLTYNEKTGKLLIDFTETVNNDNKVSDMTVEVNQTKLDGNKYINSKNEIVAKPGSPTKVLATEFFGFAEVIKSTEEIANEKIETITITPGGYSLAVEDLYDGLMLTTEGHDFFNKIKEAQAVREKSNVIIRGNSGHQITEDDVNLKTKITESNGKSYFTVEFKEVASKKLPAETYTISGKNLANTQRLAQWMVKPLARVDILAGDNRYETAVEIAKEYLDINTLNQYGSSEANVVLVNGDALVDGLAAAPLAASLADNDSGQVAPILLTKSNSLPKETKTYLRELMEAYKIADIDKVTVNLVGGEAVLSKSLERELKSLGFTVERFGGDNREETSLEVKKAIEENGGKTDQAFVVGGESEADAMSIAAVASELKAPIVVAKKGGISEDAIYELRDTDVTVIGGENAVSKIEVKEIETEAKSVNRVFGSNRQATNAEVIKKYYKDGFVGSAKNVIVAKDGANKRDFELVDALAAANFAAKVDAPIVLATNKLSVAQKNALELNAKGAHALYQVGIGVEKECKVFS